MNSTELKPDDIDDISKSMPFTGERYTPETEGEIKLEHTHRYLFAKKAAIDKDVLDIACGEGYGAAVLAYVARSVIGVDISSEAVEHASSKYTSENLSFICGSCEDIPLENNSVDLVVSFETIEHHVFHKEMMEEIKRVLRPDGLLIISSPDKREYSDMTGYKNPYHVKEIYRDEFEGLVSGYFRNICTYGQRVMYGSVIFPEDTEKHFLRYCIEHEHEHEEKQTNANLKPIYNLIVASNSELKSIAGGVLEGEIELSNVAAFKNEEIDKLGIVVAFKNEQIDVLNTKCYNALVEKQAVMSERDLLLSDISQMRGTFSWKITRPIRMFKSVFDLCDCKSFLRKLFYLRGK